LGIRELYPRKMSHLDGESAVAVFAAGLDVSWAAMAMGIKAANARTKTRTIYLETREFMCFSSSIELKTNEKLTMNANIGSY
jgi:hypothetical protein